MTIPQHQPTDRFDQPAYDCSFGEGARRFVRKSFVVRGRASQSEFWWGYLTLFIAQMGFLLIWFGVVGVLVFGALGVATFGASIEAMTGGIVGVSIVVTLAYGALFLVLVATSVPFFTLTARRLHDIGLSGWLSLIGLATGWFALVIGFLPAKHEGLRYEFGTTAPVLAPALLMAPAYPHAASPHDPTQRPAGTYPSA